MWRVFCDRGVEKVQWYGRDRILTGNQESTAHLEEVLIDELAFHKGYRIKLCPMPCLPSVLLDEE